MAEKKGQVDAKLVAPKTNAKNAKELAYEEYLRLLELAIENH